MSRFYWVNEDKSVRAKHGGYVDARHTWGLPGLHCHECGATWSAVGHDYPSVDLSVLPEHTEFVTPRPEPMTEFIRLRELVRPYVPEGTALPPGTNFGPLTGRAVGNFGAIAWLGTRLLSRADALDRLQAEGVRGLLGCRTAFRFRQKNPPELLELQIEPRGNLHPDCIPTDVPPRCPTCGRHGFGRPDDPILAAASLPSELDLFRVGNFATMVIGTERFKDAVHRLSLEGITFHELTAR
ncbi:SitI6 family double-CXXCG motif immunity protein [Myxococcus qinghaiensis]|uniref:SitI6 family double-CXXCG motif immunity protein n=1 Tax=Myxococcus qinghaiensis TaxID=2906758 RepID=UPI0020A7A689|nr:double-CXXCG motif protein [Myxococcus qinghaiensis]MCP3169670.1 double-CXXCG motif protein [Myxococcus qinghaiensis]